MSNRFSQWAPTEYVPMPVENYQQALGVNEANIQSKVDQATQIMHALRSVTPTGKDAEALHEQIMGNIDSQISELGKANLKSPEALTRINAITNNPEYISQLRQIYAMTEDAKTARDAYTTAVKDGNDRNALPYLQAMTSLYDQTGDATQFNPNLFRGTDAIPKYVNVQEKLNDILSKIKASGRYQDQSTGQYIQIKSWEGVNKNAIRQAALSQLMANTDLKDQMQRNIKYDYFMANRRDPNSALTSDAENMKAGIIESYENTKNILALAAQSKSAVAKKYGVPEAAVDQFINKQKQFLNDTEGYYNLIQKNRDNPQALNERLIMEKYVNNHVDASSDLLSYYTEKLDKKVNPYGLESVKFSHSLQLEHERQKNRKDLLQYKEALEIRRIADGTYALDIGRVGDTGEMNEEAKTKLADGRWLEEIMTKNGNEAAIGWNALSLSPAKLPVVEQVATKLGWSGNVQDADGNLKPISAIDYLKNAWQTQTAYTTGYINPKVDQGFIMSSILGGKSGLDVYQNGEKITDESKKADIFNAFRKHSSDNKTGGTAAEMAIPISTNPLNGKPAAIYTDPTDASKITYIDLPRGIAERFRPAAEIASTEKDLAYNNDRSVFVSGKKFRLTRLPGQGNPGLLAFADTDDRRIVNEAQSKINLLATEMMKDAGLSAKRGIDASYLQMAMQAINQTAQNKIQTGQENSSFDITFPSKAGGMRTVKLGVPFTILSNIETNLNEAAMLRNLRVGTLIPVGNGLGGYMDGKTLSEKVYHDAFQTLPAKGKAMDLEEAGTDKIKGSSFSLTGTIYGTDDDE